MKKLDYFLSTPVRNGYSPVCTDKPTSKIILGLGALTGAGLDLSRVKWVPESNEQVNKFVIEAGDFLVSRSNTLDRVGRAALYRGGLSNCSYPDLMMKFRVDEEKILPDFMELILQSAPARKYFMRCASGTSSTMAKITKSVVESLKIPEFPLSKQREIAKIARTWHNAIEKTESLIAAKENQFEWLKYKILKNVEQHADTKRVRLGELLKYEQPTKYIVKSTNYINNGHTPVLTANKSFILGYTNEKENIFNKCPAIIFDDFTTASKYVDFHFKVKSSAMKILLSKNDKVDMRYVYTAMSLTKLPLGGHKRYWISEYQFLDIPLPTLEIQKEMSTSLESAQKEVKLLKKTLAKYRLQKRGLMQKLLTGEWQVKASPLTIKEKRKETNA